jgi:hypothetical protein
MERLVPMQIFSRPLVSRLISWGSLSYQFRRSVMNCFMAGAERSLNVRCIRSISALRMHILVISVCTTVFVAVCLGRGAAGRTDARSVISGVEFPNPGEESVRGLGTWSGFRVLEPADRASARGSITSFGSLLVLRRDTAHCVYVVVLNFLLEDDILAGCVILGL